MCIEDIPGFENLDTNFDNLTIDNEEMLEKLSNAAYSFVCRFGNPDVVHFGIPNALFDVMLEMSIYLCLLNKKQRDIIFFVKLMKYEDGRGLFSVSHDAKEFIMENCRRFFPFLISSVLDEIDAILGTLICVLTLSSYSTDNMCGFLPHPMNFPNRDLLRHIRKIAQSIFPNWDSDGIQLYSSRPFALFVCLYFKYRSTYGRDTAVSMIYRIADTLDMTENENFFELVFKTVSFVDGVCRYSEAEKLFQAVTLWHIFRVLRRMSWGATCDEWMECGCEPECDSCEVWLAYNKAKNTGDYETEKIEDDDVFGNDDPDKDDLDLVDLNDFEEINSSEWNKYYSDTD